MKLNLLLSMRTKKEQRVILELLLCNKNTINWEVKTI